MSQNTLIEKIKQDAAAKITEIKATETAEVECVQRETDAAIAILTNAHAVALKKKQSQMELVLISQAKQAGNINLQTTKRKHIDSIFDEVKTGLESQSDDEYVAFFQKYVQEIIPKGIVVKVVHIPATRQDATKNIMSNLSLSGEIIPTAGIKAGLIIHAEDGVYDVTLDRLMSEKRAELEMIVVNKVMS